jgi:hypothetical protein
MMELVEKFGTPDGEDGLKIRGFVRAVAVNTRTGEVVAERETRNAITTLGYQLLAKQMTAAMTPTAADGVGFADVGTDATAFASTMTSLVARVSDGGPATATNARISVAGTTSATATNGCTAQYTWSYDTGQAKNSTAATATATLREVGLFNNSVSNAATMIARATFGDIVKSTDVQVSFSYQLRFN